MGRYHAWRFLPLLAVEPGDKAMTHSFRVRGNTVVEILVTLVLIAVAVSIWMVTRDRGMRRPGTSNRMQNMVHVAGICQALVIYATGQPDQQFPGIDAEGNAFAADPAARFFTLVSIPLDPLDPRMLVTPTDTATTVWDGVSPFTSANHSYALLDISELGTRRKKWSNGMDASTPLISDRNTATDGKSTASVWNSTSWKGAVGWPDGHVTFESTPVVVTSMASADHLFAGGPDDAWLRHNMTEQRLQP